jgi:hypothetical protein
MFIVQEGLVVRILITLPLYISYIAPLDLPSTLSPPYFKQLQDVSLFYFI